MLCHLLFSRDISNCGIKQVNAKAFRRLPSLQKLYIKLNKFRIIVRCLYKKLILRDMSSNEVTDLPPGVFNSTEKAILYMYTGI